MHPAGPSSSPPRTYAPAYPPQPSPYADYYQHPLPPQQHQQHPGAQHQHQQQQQPYYPPQFLPPYGMMWPGPPPPGAYGQPMPMPQSYGPIPPHQQQQGQQGQGRPYQPRGGYRGGRGRRPSGGPPMGPYNPRGGAGMMPPPVPGPGPGPGPASPAHLPMSMQMPMSMPMPLPLPMPMSLPGPPPQAVQVASSSSGAYYQPIPTPPSPPESLLPPTPQPASSSSPSASPEPASATPSASASDSHTPTPTSPISDPDPSPPSPNRTPKPTPPTIPSVLQAIPDEAIRIHIARFRPGVNEAGVVTIARHLSRREAFPSGMREGAVLLRSVRPKPAGAKPRRAQAQAAPASAPAPSSAADPTETAVSSLPPAPANHVPTPSSAPTQAAAAEDRQETPRPLPAPAPAAAPKPKPSSWAGLFRPSVSTSAAASAAASSAAAASGSGGLNATDDATASTSLTAPTSPLATAQAAPQSQSQPGTAATVTSPSHRQAEPVRRRPATKVDLELLVAEGRGVLDEVLRQGESWRADLTVPTGLWNTGNLCFANCILQTLVYCGPFYELVMEIGGRIGGAVGGRTPFLDAMTLFLRQIPITTPPDPWKARLDELNFPGLASGGAGAGGEQAELEAIKRKEPQGLVPDFVYSGMSDYPKSKQILKGGQEDADEFFCFLLDVLEEELLTVLKIFSANPTPASASSSQSTFSGPGKRLAPGKVEDEQEVRRPVSPAFAARGAEDGEWMEVGKRNKKVVSRSIQAAETAITKMFCLKTRTVDRRPGAKDNVVIEPQQRLSLSVIDDKIANIEQALLAFAAVETMDVSSGPGLTRQVMLDTLPPVLVLHLQRWGPARNGRWEKTEKELSIGQVLEIPNEVLSPARRSATLPKYRLFAVLYHDGLSAQHGHYTLDVLRQDCSEWIHYDNEQISLASRPGEEKLRDGRVAYMLYYLRIA
ncbi:cysteine proteinase [Calocera cornea HHB12733]|uniref:Ubiquitin carboxyl-terminal hydrolase n=1 Tax=Calocera cornea HHB12733 TaxID=1353952 RepID=A0A165DUB2_9BASI|nr:cysteine proteinase [Calocera cornea HHB12733]